MIPTRTAWISPLERLYALQREFDRAFETDTNGQNTWVPPMDVVESSDEVLCHIEVPGLKPEDIEIRVQDNMLVIAGEKRVAESEQQEGGFRSMERRYGRFERSFTLPRTIDTNNVKARHENGVLTVVLPKVEASKPRRIQIEGAEPAPRELSK
ncbi:MAG TPA: Hsp20/alpha crystallin family protein [Longimicrobiales bacterium]